MSFIERPTLGARSANRQFAAREGHLVANPREFTAWTPSSARPVTAPPAFEPRTAMAVPTADAPPAPEPVAEARPDSGTAAGSDAVSVSFGVTDAASANPNLALLEALRARDEPCAECARAARALAELEDRLNTVSADNQALARLLARLSQMDDERIEALRDDVQHAATAIALEIIGRSVDVDAGWLRDLVLRELQGIEGRLTRVRINVNPADYALLAADWEAAAPQASLHASDSVSRGGFVIETPHETIDGDPRSRIAWAGRGVASNA